jgi:tetratricopeptide (TPR) repeat protein
MLIQPDWRSRVKQAREQLPKTGDGSSLLPLAEILTQAQSGQVIEAIGKIHKLARADLVRSAMEEAYYSLNFAPTYLPLHTLIADLLIQEGHEQDALAKFTIVAQAYSVRGEAAQATSLLRRIVQLAPMDLNVRTRLVEQLVARGQVDEAMGEYLDLADIYYRLADLDLARKTYTTALRHAQQSTRNHEWSIKILQRMADIDMQRLDWKQAMRVFEQIRTLRPDDMSVRKNLVEINLRLNQPGQVAIELESFFTYLDSVSQRKNAIPFLEELLHENPGREMLIYALASEYGRAGQVTEAVTLLDELGNTQLDARNLPGAVRAIEAIIALKPPNVKEYQDSLAALKKK